MPSPASDRPDDVPHPVRRARSVWSGAAVPSSEGEFVGRDAELTAVRAALEDGFRGRLVTLVGPAGAGKTRLAAETARRELESRSGRVAWVSLGTIADAALVAPAIASSLGLAEGPAETLVAAIGSELVGRIVNEDAVDGVDRRVNPRTDTDARRAGDAPSDDPRGIADSGVPSDRAALLVLDALVQLLPDVAVIDAIRDAAPDLAILATSRRPLGLSGEVVIEVGPLALPDPGADPAVVADSPAARLLAARAGTSGRPLPITAANAEAIADVARRLDGLPLALEIGGAALRRLEPSQLVDRLTARPSGVPASADPTLAAALDRSVDLLAAGTALVYRRLGVIVGDVDVDLARGVVDRSVLLGLADPGIDTGSAIAELVEARLLQRSADAPGEDGSGVATGERPASSGGRLRMLETIRADAVARLDANGELETVEWAHAHEVVERIEALDARLLPTTDPADLRAIDRLAPEAGAAFDRAAARGGDDLCLRIASALAEWWRMRGHLTEGRLRIELALRRSTGRRDEARARAAYAGASLSYRQGDFERARTLLAEAIGLFEALGDASREARARNLLGLVAFDQGRMDEALASAEAGLRIRRQLGNELEVAASLNTVGGIRHYRADLAGARAALEEGLEIRERLGDESGAAVCLANLALVDRDVGDLERGAARLERAVDTRRRLGDRLREAVTLHNLGLVRLDQRRADEAWSLLHDALAMSTEHGDRVEAATALADLSIIAREQGRLAEAWRLATDALRLATRIRALGVVALGLEAVAPLAGGEDPADGARLWAAAAALRRRTGYALLLADERRVRDEIDEARARVDPSVWEQAWTEGSAMDERAAAATALDRTEATPVPA